MKASMPKAAGDDDDLLEDSDEDDLPSDFDMDDDSEDEEQAELPDEEEDDALSLVEGSDNDDLVSLNDDVPDGLIEWDGTDSEGEAEEQSGEWGGIEGAGKKRKREETSREKRKKLRSLPTFASYEDYAKMIEDGPEDDI
jgi:ribosome biogenesis protein MAK21